jgi:integrase
LSPRKFAAATFEHDTARPVEGYAAPQLHTHAVIFNVTERENGQTRALQPQELFASQNYATNVYRSELAVRLKDLGYTIERGEFGQPEIKGYTKEYMEANSQRREQVKEHMRASGLDGPAAAQIAAHRTRDSKQLLSPEEVLRQHRVLAAQHGNQADRVVAEARQQVRQHAYVPDKAAQVPGLRDRALIGLMVYTFARVGAAVSMRVEDFFVQGRRGWVRLHEKGGKEHEMPTHHNLDRYLEEYIAAAGIGKDSKQERKGPLFRTVKGRTGELTANPLLQSDVWRMIRRRASQAGIETEIGCHTFRATGITAYLKNGGRLETAQQMAAHESARTTGLYDRRSDEISLDEVERIVI